MKRIVLLPLVFFFLGCGPGFVETATSTAVPVPISTPVVVQQYDPAALVEAITDGLVKLQFDQVVEKSAESLGADTKAAHTTGLGQLVEDVAPLIPLCAVGIPALMITVIALGVLWYLRQAKDGQQLASLMANLARLEGYFRAAGVDVTQEE